MLLHGSGVSREEIVPSSNWLFFFFFAFFFVFFFSIFFFCCCCFSTCTIKLYHLQPEPATARPSCLRMVHTLYKDCLEKIAIGRKIRTRVGKTMPQSRAGTGNRPPSSSLSPSLFQNKPSAGGQEGGLAGPHNQPQVPQQERSPTSCPHLANS